MASTHEQLFVHVPHQGVLPDAFTPGDLSATLNAGLLHQRYAGLPLVDSRRQGQHDASPDSGGLLSAFRTAYAAQAQTGQTGLDDFHGRMDRHTLPGTKQIRRDIELTSRLVIGLGYDHPLENGLLFHHTLGVPYLPATSVKGLLRTWVRLLAGDEYTRSLFGFAEEGADRGEAGQLMVLDALPKSWPELTDDIINCHLPAYYSGDDSGDWPNPGAVPREAPRPAAFLAVEPGTAFRFHLAAHPGVNLEAAMDVLSEALALVGIGAKTGAGYGRVGTFTGEDYTHPTRIVDMAQRIMSSLPTPKLSVFLSHHSDDKDYVRQLGDALTRRGVVPWLDEDHILPGDRISGVIQAAMERVVAVAALLTPRSLGSTWVNHELELAMQLESDPDGPRARILPLLVDTTPSDLRHDPLGRFNTWFTGNRLDRRYVRADGDVDRLAHDLCRAVSRQLDLPRARSVQIVCDSRGSGRMVGEPDLEALNDWPTIVLRPHRGERSFGLTVGDPEWTAWRKDMHQGLSALLSDVSRQRTLRLHLRCQLAVAVWLGSLFNRQTTAQLEVYDHRAPKDQQWRSVSGHAPTTPGDGREVVDPSPGEVVTAIIHKGDSDRPTYTDPIAWHQAHRDGPLVAHSYADHLDDNGHLPLDFDVVGWANQVVADLTQGNPQHLRLCLDCPVWAAVPLGQLLTRIEAPKLSVLEWDKDNATYRECLIR